MLISLMMEKGYQENEVAMQVCGKTMEQLENDDYASCACDRKAMALLPPGYRCEPLDGCNCATHPNVMNDPYYRG